MGINDNSTMNKNEQAVNYKSIAIGAFGIVFGIVAFIAGNVLGAAYSVNWKEAALLSVIITIMGLICWLFVSVILWNVYRVKIKDMIELKKSDKESICDKINSICCYRQAFKDADIEIDIDPETQKRTRIHPAKEVEDLELGVLEEEWTDIWIFSENLSTELRNGHAEPILINNCTKGIKYSMFYLESENNYNETYERTQQITNSLKSWAQKNIKFYALKTEQGYIGLNTLPLLCGSIMFSNSRDVRDDSCYFKCGFLSLRKDLQHRPVYYKMPKCMLEQYATYFKKIVKKETEEVML